jgi:PTH1 family peptidyl-tRNA hydrolase
VCESSFTEPGEALLFAALGNPGERYKNTRHNIGFIFADHIVSSFKLNAFHYCEKMRAYLSVTEKFGKNVIVLKPNTYMNLSGKAVTPAIDAFSVERKDVFVVHDDIHLDFGTHRLKRGGGGNGGHNGIISIEEELGHNEFNRIKLGIGKPEVREMLKDYVLTNFLDDELSFMDNSWALSWEQMFRTILEKGLFHAMNDFNRRVR